MIYHAGFFKQLKAQIKIQQMAFVLVALIIFIAIASLFYLSISFSNLKKKASYLNDEEAIESVRKLHSTPEFALTSQECSNCIDLDKVFLLKNRRSYQGFWNFDFLMVEKISPIKNEECSDGNYPNCKTITIIESQKIGTPSIAYVSLCHWSNEKGGYLKCELGRIYASGKAIKDEE